MNINNLDLNLLKAFHTLYQERNVGRAGSLIGLAQPSMSNALSRLRHQFDDPLFHRSPDGMVPTARAEEIAPTIQQALSLMSGLLERSRFDPKRIEADVTIAAADLDIMTIAAPMMTYLEDEAPGLCIRFEPLNKRDLISRLDDESLTFAIGTFATLPKRFHRRPMTRNSFVCISRPDHPLIGESLTLEAYLNARHVLMTLSGDTSGAVDKALKQQGLKRQVVMTCTQFALLPDIIARTDLIATVPASLAAVAERAGCVIHEAPLQLPNWESEIVWTQKTANTDLGKFLISAIQSRFGRWQQGFS